MKASFFTKVKMAVCLFILIGNISYTKTDPVPITSEQGKPKPDSEINYPGASTTKAFVAMALYPEDAILQLVGGSGKEFWVNGKNYPRDMDRRPKPNVQPGAWRLEVSPTVQQTQDYFLHVLFVDDADAVQVESSMAELIKENNNIGIRVAEWKVLFPVAFVCMAVIDKI